MRFSVFTPTHNPKYFFDCLRSLQAQTHADWEWIVVLNGPVRRGDISVNDPRVTLRESYGIDGNIGALKREACLFASGDIFVELDHDDLLHPECLAKLAAVFEKSIAIGFVYSNTARFCSSGARPGDYGAFYGWDSSRKVEAPLLNGTPAYSMNLWQPTAQALSRIWFAPDHVRAWRRETYWKAGGHDPRHEICDDYSLILRTYELTDFHAIDEPLYYYRVGENTSAGSRNAEIQVKQREFSTQYRERIVKLWAQRRGLQLLDLCSHGSAPAGYTGIDIDAQAGEIRADLAGRWPLEDGSVGVIRANDALEHLADKLHTMSEIWRVLAHGGWLLSETPASSGRGADQDPTHQARWNQNSFWYYASTAHNRYLPKANQGQRFQVWDLCTYYPNDQYKRHEISYVRAHLSAIKDGARLPGAYELEEEYLR